MDRFTPDSCLQAVGDVPRNFLHHADRDLADVGVKRLGRFDNARRGAVVAHHLDQRDQMRRVERVPKDEQRRIAPTALHLPQCQPRGGTGHQSAGCQRRFYLGKGRVLDGQAFRHVFLHEPGAFDDGMPCRGRPRFQD